MRFVSSKGRFAPNQRARSERVAPTIVLPRSAGGIGDGPFSVQHSLIRYFLRRKVKLLTLNSELGTLTLKPETTSRVDPAQFRVVGDPVDGE
ncbi:MAG TPA: hypothetical protein VMN76_10810, partial [Acidobacteriota bacterium]|nr:hypothetical protein [Acidobacteriota bacterium]